MAFKLSQSKALFTSNSFNPRLKLNESSIYDYNNIYVKFSICTPSKTLLNEDVILFKNNLLKSVAQIFGEMNIHVPLDIMRYDPVSKEVIIRCNTILFQKFTCSLLLKQPNMFHVGINKSSYNNPLYLMFNSRCYKHCLKRRRRRR